VACAQVLPLGPAFEARLQPGDVIRSVDGTAVTAATVFDALKGPPLSKVQLTVQKLCGSVRETVLDRMPVSKGDVEDLKRIFDIFILIRSKILALDRASAGLFDNNRTASELMPLMDDVFDAWSRSVTAHHARAARGEQEAHATLRNLEAALERLQSCSRSELGTALEQLTACKAAQADAAERMRCLAEDLSEARQRVQGLEQEVAAKDAELARMRVRESKTRAHGDESAQRLGQLEILSRELEKQLVALDAGVAKLQSQRSSAREEQRRLRRVTKELEVMPEDMGDC